MKSNADKFLDCLPPAERSEYRRFEKAILEFHLKRRDKNDTTSAFVIDKRNAELGWGKRAVLREPPTPGRVNMGRSTSDKIEAAFWVSQYYAPLYWRTRREGLTPSSVQLTVAEAVNRYIESVTERKEGDLEGRVPRKLKSRVSKLKVHVLPAMRTLVLSMVQQNHVTAALKGMRVTKRRRQPDETTPAMHSTRLETLKALVAVYKYIFPNEQVPFAQAFLERTEVEHIPIMIDAYELEATDHEMEKQSTKGVMNAEQVERSLLGALESDVSIGTNHHLVSFLPNSAHILALLVGLGLRVSELVSLRWCNINLDEGFVMIPQSKIVRDANGKPNKESHRYTPLQNSLLPWLFDLMRISGIVDRRSKSFVVQLTRDKSNSKVSASEDSVIKRVSATLKWAGTKQLGKATHFGRSTHISLASNTTGIPSRMIQAFVGHSPYKSSVTGKYFRLQRKDLKPEHNVYLKISSPELLRSELARKSGAQVNVGTGKRRATAIRACRTKA